MVWEKPEYPFLKINCDGTCFPNLQRLGYGCVATDSAGSVVGVRASFHLEGFTALDAEGIALVRVMKWAVELGWESCIFETDYSEVFNLFQAGPSSSNLTREWLKTCSPMLNII